MKTRYGNKVFPLTAAQMLHFFSLKYCPRKELLNIGTSLTIEIDIDKDLLRESIGEAYDRQEAMRIRLVEDKEGNAYQYIVKKDDREIPYFDFTGWKEEDAKSKMEEWTKTPFEIFDSPLNKIVIIKTPDGFEGLYFCANHITMDAQSLILFLRDVIEIYCFKKYSDHEELTYPKEMASYIKQLKKDLEYEAGSKASIRDREFFQKYITEREPIFTHIDGRTLLENERIQKKNPNLRAATYVTQDINANIANFNLEEGPSNELMQFCKDNQTSMVCLLLMGLRTYLQKENDIDDVSIVSTIARRATLQEKRSGGTRIHCFPFRTIVSKEDTFIEGLCKIRDGQNELFRHANFSSVEYFGTRSKHFKLEPGQTYDPMSLTYQPMTQKENGLGKLGDIQYKSTRYTNGVAAQALYLTVSHRGCDNGLEFGFEHQTGVVTYEKLEYMYYYMCKILFEGVRNPDKTVGEIIASV